MDKRVKHGLADNWDELIAPIREEITTSARETGAFQRQRGVREPSDLLRLVLMYAILSSLRLVVLWAVALGICDISRQALDNRLGKCEGWLRHLLGVVLDQWFTSVPQDTNTVQRVLLRDASSIARRGSPGTEMRLHLTWDLLQQQPATLSVTDAHGGEEVSSAGLQAHDLIIGDRAYGVWRHIQTVQRALAYYIFRIAWSNCPLCTLEGEPFDLIAWLEGLDAQQTVAEHTLCVAADAQAQPVRLLVGRLPPEAAAQAQERARRSARKNKRAVSPQTLMAAQFCILLTNLPATTWPARTVLALYRIRWQIEWCFRRWKSLCYIDHLPAYPAHLATVTFLAKVLLVLLLEQQLATCPWADYWTNGDPLPVFSTLVQLTYSHMVELLCPRAAIRTCLTDPRPFIRHLRSSRRKRKPQMQTAMCLLENILDKNVSTPNLC